ncbi:MAG: hypothetical protein ACOYWZ_17410 [Bacillota bacterium]
MEELIQGIAIAIKSALVVVGVASGVGLVVQIITSFAPLSNLISKIVQLLTLFLKPIGDIFAVLLYPILLILKPIILMIKTMFIPFIQIAMKLMAEGAEKVIEGDLAGGTKLISLAAMDLLIGLGFVLNMILYEAVQSLFTALFTLMLNVISIFFPQLSDKIPALTSQFNSIFDKIQGIYISSFVDGLNSMHSVLGVNINNFSSKIIKNSNDLLLGDDKISGVFVEDIQNFKTFMEDSWKSMLDKEQIGPAWLMEQLVHQMGVVGKTAVKNMMRNLKRAAEEEFKKLINPINWVTKQQRRTAYKISGG